MKVLLITNLYPPQARGGAERIVEQLAQGLVAGGDSVVVATSAPWSQVTWGWEVRPERGVKVYRIWHWNFVWQLHTGRTNLARRFLAHAWSLINIFFAWQVWRIIKIEKPDVVHTHNLAGTSFLIPWLIKILRLRQVHTLHDVQLAIPSGRLLVGEEYSWLNSGWPARAFQWFQKCLWGSPAVVTAPSEWLVKYYSKQNYFKRSRILIVRHIFKTVRRGETSVSAIPSSAHIRFPASHRFTILYAGQIERAKGVIMFIRLFAELWNANEISDTELIVVGSGEDLKTAELFAATCPTIHLVNKLKHEQLLNLLPEVDVVVVPSLLYENSPTIIIEALAAGKPVAVSAVGGAAELITTANGWVVEPAEPAWRTQIKWLVERRGLVQNLCPTLPTRASFLAEIKEIYTNLFIRN